MSSSTLSATTGSAPAQRVPAWKRLGLKLKQPGSGDQSHTSTAPPTTNAPYTSKPESFDSAKRKSSGTFASDHFAKKPRRDNWEPQQQQTQTPPPKKAKSVTFAAETSEAPAPAAATSDSTTNGNQAAAAKKGKKKAKQPGKKKPGASTTNTATTSSTTTKPAGKQGPVNLEPALAYLRQWRSDRASWKFNKNHQTRLLEQVFADETTIPTTDINTFYEYIQGLQGGVRTRLAELARGVRARDMDPERGFSTGAKNAGAKDKEKDKEARERKQKEYEDVIAGFLRRQEQEKEQEQTDKPDKRRFDEIDYVLRTADMEMQRRVVKRMRAEMVLDELSDAGQETDAGTTTSASSSTTAAAGSKEVDMGEADGNGNGNGNGNQRLALNDASQQRVKRRKSRKSRTAAADDSSSSESDSDSDSSSSDSSDDDDDDADGGTKVAIHSKPTGAGAAGTSDSSSSSSSSSSEASESSDSEDSSEDED